ncbi:hypothetical protein ACP70R_014914 [Stipagrostis hirtigluma subsp. patula]
MEMDTAQERELHGRQAWWPLDTMACSSYSTSSFLFQRDPHLTELIRCFGPGIAGIGAGDHGAYQHELELVVVPDLQGMESPVSEASVAGLPTAQDAAATPGELDELLQDLWDSGEEKALFFSSSSAMKETSTASVQHDDRFTLSSNSPSEPTLSDNMLVLQPQAGPPSSSSSHCNADPHVCDAGGVHCQVTRANCSTSKRPVPEAERGESSKRSRMASATAGAGTVARPFTVVKPGGADGDVTLADINARILTAPARSVRHPVGKFACAPRAATGNRPAPSGKTVAGFTRLRTAGRGTVTIVRTRG